MNRHAHSHPRALFGVTTGLSARPFFNGLFPFLLSHGVETHLVTGDSTGLHEWCKTQGVALHVINLSRNPHPAEDMAALASLLKTIRRARPDVIICGTPKMGLLCTIGARITNIPSIYVVHGLRYETSQGINRRVLKALEKLACMLATEVAPVSRSVMDQLNQDLGVRREKLTMVANGSANGILPKSHTKADADKHDGTRFGFIGRITRDKGISELALAWMRHIEEHPRDILHIFGAVEDQSIARLQELPRCTIHGHRDDIDTAYAMIDVLLLPSHREGLPTVVLEAASWRIPAILSDATGCKDAIVPDKTGWQFPVGDVAALARCMHVASANPGTRTRFGEEAERWALAQFDRNTIHAAWLARITNIVNK